MSQGLRWCGLFFFAIAFPFASASAQERWFAGFGKAEITPKEPVRLSGYANRDKPHTGVADPLFARAMVLTTSPREFPLPPKDTGSHTVVMISIDSIAIVGVMTRQIEDALMSSYGLSRSDFVICSTHSHAAPHAAGGLNNLYRTPLSSDEQAAIERYAERVKAGILKAVDAAFALRVPAKLEVAQTTAGFAVNRRVLKEGLWTGFGKQDDGPVDRRVQLLRVSGDNGKLLGATFMYAATARRWAVTLIKSVRTGLAWRPRTWKPSMPGLCSCRLLVAELMPILNPDAATMMPCITQPRWCPASSPR